MHWTTIQPRHSNRLNEENDQIHFESVDNPIHSILFLFNWIPQCQHRTGQSTLKIYFPLSINSAEIRIVYFCIGIDAIQCNTSHGYHINLNRLKWCPTDRAIFNRIQYWTVSPKWKQTEIWLTQYWTVKPEKVINNKMWSTVFVCCFVHSFVRMFDRDDSWETRCCCHYCYYHCIEKCVVHRHRQQCAHFEYFVLLNDSQSCQSKSRRGRVWAWEWTVE